MLNKNAKLSFFNARRRTGDSAIIATKTGYSISHITNIIAGRKRVNDEIANQMFDMSRRRMKNSAKA